MKHLAFIAAAVFVLLGLTGCHTTGPDGLTSGRSLYNTAIANTANQQTMLNLVRLRYRDAPVFLEVTSVSTTLELQSSLGSSLGLGFGPNRGGDTFGLSAGLRYTERPTVTYLPLQGEQFATRVLSPIRPSLLVLLANSGWAIDRILAVCVQNLGPLDNAPSASGPTPDREPVYRDFREFAQLLRTLQREHQLTLSLFGADSTDIAIHVPVDAVQREEYRRACELLGLDPADTEPDGSRTIVLTPALVAGRAPEGRRVPVVTRSLMSAMFYLSQGVTPPERDAEKGLVTLTQLEDETGEFEWSSVLGGYFEIQSGKRRPKTAGPAVRYRGRWFWIDESDLTSKSTLGLLQQLFALQSGKIDNTGPILTLPLAP